MLNLGSWLLPKRKVHTRTFISTDRCRESYMRLETATPQDGRYFGLKIKDVFTQWTFKSETTTDADKLILPIKQMHFLFKWFCLACFLWLDFKSVIIRPDNHPTDGLVVCDKSVNLVTDVVIKDSARIVSLWMSPPSPGPQIAKSQYQAGVGSICFFPLQWKFALFCGLVCFAPLMCSPKGALTSNRTVPW